MMTQETVMNGYTLPAAVVSVEERLVFLRKVYSLLAASLGTAAVGGYLGAKVFLPVVMKGFWLFVLLEFALIFFAMYARRKPGLNMIALFSFTTVSGLTLAPMLAVYAGSVVEALALTALTFSGLTGYVIFSKKDFSFMSGFLTVGLLILIFGGLINLFFHNTMAHMVMSGMGVLIFSGFILYDTSNILRNYSTDEYVSATLTLYLDVLNLFVHLLQLLGMSRD